MTTRMTRIVPGAALAYLLGNTAFFVQGRLLAVREQRQDVTAQCHGISIVIFYAYALMVLKPAWEQWKDPVRVWEAGMFACFMTGVLELLSLCAIRTLRNFIPRAAMLSAVAGVSLTFISLNFLTQIYESPSYALLPALFMFLAAASNVRLPFNIPIGLAALVLGTALAWGIRLWQGRECWPAPEDVVGGACSHGKHVKLEIGLHLPVPALEHLGRSFEHGWQYLPVIIPMWLVNLVNNLSNIESAAAVGDEFHVIQSMVMDAIVTIISAACGNCFPTSIFIGQPALKAMGVTSGYALSSSVLLALLGLTGAMAMVLQAVPVAAGVGFLAWIGVLVTKQAFERDAAALVDTSAAVVVGLAPPLASWGVGLVTATVSAAQQLVASKGHCLGAGAAVANATAASTAAAAAAAAWTPSLHDVAFAMDEGGTFVFGLMALSQGYLLVSICLSSTLVYVLEGRFLRAAMWMIIAAILSSLGLMHSFSLAQSAVHPEFGLTGVTAGMDAYSRTYAFVYFAAAILCVVLHVVDRDRGLGPTAQIRRFCRDLREAATAWCCAEDGDGPGGYACARCCASVVLRRRPSGLVSVVGGNNNNNNLASPLLPTVGRKQLQQQEEEEQQQQLRRHYVSSRMRAA